MFKIKEAVSKLFLSYKNTHNDQIKRAAHDIAVAKAMIDVCEGYKDRAATIIKSAHVKSPPGTNVVLLAENGVAVTLRVSNGATRLDRAAIMPEIIKLGWRAQSGMPLTVDDINTLLDHCSKQSAPAVSISSSITDTHTR